MESVVSQPHSPNNPLPDMNQAVNGQMHTGQAIAQAARNSTGNAMVNRAMEERGHNLANDIEMMGEDEHSYG